jgi:hypothetical protein
VRKIQKQKPTSGGDRLFYFDTFYHFGPLALLPRQHKLAQTHCIWRVDRSDRTGGMNFLSIAFIAYPVN